MKATALKPYVLIARPDHWVKNIFVLPGIVLGLIFTPFHYSVLLARFLPGMLAVCFIASANYVINEWLDREFDRHHPTKKNRPAVSGAVNAQGVLLEYFLLVGLGAALSMMISFEFCLFSSFLLFMGLVYNVKPIRSKDLAYMDVLSESVNNPIRLCLGWAMVNSTVFPPTSLVMGYWFGGAFLMAAKRLAEYRSINDPVKAGLYRRSFSVYTVDKLLASCLFYAMTSTFFLGAFFMKYKIELIIIFPFVLGLFSWYFFLSLKPESVAQKPEHLYKEKRLMRYVGLLGLLFVLLLLVDLPFLHFLLWKP